MRDLINNSKPQAPCMNCERRYVGCHAECEDYKEFRKLADKMSEEFRKKKNKHLDITMFQKGSQKRFGRPKK